MNRTLLVITGILSVLLVFAVGVIVTLVWLRPGSGGEAAGGAQLGVWYDAEGTEWELLPDGELIITQAGGQVRVARYSVSADRILLRLDTNASAELLTGVAEVVFDCDWRERAVLRCSATAGGRVVPLVLARDAARARQEFGTVGGGGPGGGGAPSDRTGAEYVAVPAGNGVAAFRIGRTEVTNAQYAQCVAAGACTVPGTSGGCNYTNSAYAEHPVVCVTREQARAYAAWAGGALPTEAQWLRACQGDDGRTYPWGNQPPDATLANFYYEGRQDYDTTPVGSYPAGASPYGALDMAGNVWEWVEPDDGDDGRYIYIMRGGAFNFPAVRVGCGARVEYGYDVNNYVVGFRVVSPGP